MVDVVLCASFTLFGVSIGAVLASTVMAERIKDYKYFSETRVSDYKESFHIGFQTKHQFQPFIQPELEKKEEESYVSPIDDGFSLSTFDEEPKRAERWDD